LRGWVGVGDWVCVGGIVGVTEGTGECVGETGRGVWVAVGFFGVSVEDAVRVGSSVKVREGRFSSTLRVSGGSVAVSGAPSPIVELFSWKSSSACV